MSLITKEHLNLALQSIKNLIAKKLDKSDLQAEIATDDDVLDLLIECEVVDPLVDSNGMIFTNNKNEIYTL